MTKDIHEKPFISLNQVYEFHVLADDEQPPGPNGKRLLSYWTEKRGTRAYPNWNEIELMDMFAIADSMIVKDVIDGGRDFLNRFWGSGITRSTGFDGTGKLHTDLYASQPEGPQFETYLATITSGAPVAVHRDPSFIAGREYVTYDALHVPVGHAARAEVTHLITVHDFVMRNPQQTSGPLGNV